MGMMKMRYKNAPARPARVSRVPRRGFTSSVKVRTKGQRPAGPGYGGVKIGFAK